MHFEKVQASHDRRQTDRHERSRSLWFQAPLYNTEPETESDSGLHCIRLVGPGKKVIGGGDDDDGELNGCDIKEAGAEEEPLSVTFATEPSSRRVRASRNMMLGNK